MSDKRFALLIDSDNISAKYIDSILDEMTRHGVATYRRIYGDFTDYHMNKAKKKPVSILTHSKEYGTVIMHRINCDSSA